MSGGGLRRRGDLAPILTPSSSQRALVDETEDPFEAYVISTPCFITVSNDPIDPDDFPELGESSRGRFLWIVIPTSKRRFEFCPRSRAVQMTHAVLLATSAAMEFLSPV
jgi:hypothetical protein